MGRPIKKGLNYFMCPVEFMQDDRILQLRHNHGANGLALYLTLLCDIFNAGYYKICSDAYLYKLAGEMRMKDRKVVAMLQWLADHELLDAPLYRSHGVLTSKWIQQQYFSAKTRKLSNEYLSDFKYLVFSVKTTENEEFLQKKGTPSRVEKSREEKSREKKNINTTTTTTATHDEAVEAVEAFEIESGAECENQQTMLNQPVAGRKAATKGGGGPAASDRPVTELQATNGETKLQAAPGQAVTVKSFADCIRLFRENLMPSEDWQAALVRTSGKGMPILGEVEAVLLHFESHILVNSMGYNILNEHEFARRFISWWRCMDYKTAAEIGAGPSLRTADSNGGRRGRNQGGRSPVVRESRIDSMMEMKEQIEANALKMMQSC